MTFIITLVILIIAFTAYKVWKINQRVKHSDIFRAFVKFEAAVKAVEEKAKAARRRS